MAYMLSARLAGMYENGNGKLTGPNGTRTAVSSSALINVANLPASQERGSSPVLRVPALHVLVQQKRAKRLAIAETPTRKSGSAFLGTPEFSVPSLESGALPRLSRK